MAKSDPDEYIPKELPNDLDILSHINKNEQEMQNVLDFVTEAEKSVNEAPEAEKAAAYAVLLELAQKLFAHHPIWLRMVTSFLKVLAGKLEINA